MTDTTANPTVTPPTTDDNNSGTQNPGGEKPKDESKAPWEKNGTKFDPETAWTLIQNLQAERDAEKAKRSEYEKAQAEAEKAKLTDLEKAQAEAKEASERAAKAEAALLKTSILAEKAVPANLHEFVTGTTKEELRKSADKVLSAFGNGNSASGNPLQKTPQPTVSTGLNDNDAAVEMNPAKLASKVRRSY